ncbi:MAG: phenylalanine--tRNA ligase subunit beta, partial [Oscillospiraceae bacterium]|nr:phenylalanine--tRNA ligase subunit beta [Oscillospiraceae bacterium]
TVTGLGGEISGVVIGKVLTIDKHPEADRLFVCSVDVGDGSPRQIITGATNVFAGAVIPAALDGAFLPGGKKIKTGKMRGLESQGMLCSGEELGIDGLDQPGADVDGILILDDSFTIGADAAEALMLKDTVIEFEITNNRPDCLSVIGLAREAAAALYAAGTIGPEACRALNGQTPAACPDSAQPPLEVVVEESGLCPRYAARIVRNVKIGPSPLWMRRRLRACGVRPINNIVDITNYVMLETGQPMHAFDLACVKGRKLVIRRAKDGEVLETLDGRGRALNPSMLVIADERDATAVAGVMGGAASEITEKTTAIVFESANFNGPSVRKTALALAMRTDASSRFEKGLDPSATVTALERACQLVEELSAGEVVPGVSDINAVSEDPIAIPFEQKTIENFLGVEIPDLHGLLESVGFRIADGTALVPSWRRDVALWQDLAEEAARLHGYDRIPSILPPSKNQGWLTPKQSARARLHHICVSLGFYEALTYSFVGPADFDAARIPVDNARTIRNPLGEEHSMMRTALLPSFLKALGNNVRNQQVWLYELSNIYKDSGSRLPEEPFNLILGGFGGGMGYFTLKGAVEELIARFVRRPPDFTRASEPAFHPGRCAEVSLGGQKIGVIGELHPELGYPSGGAVCELDAETLVALGAEARFRQIPKYPAVSRDLALICPKETAAADIRTVIRKAGGSLLAECVLFDVYTGQNIPEGHRSLAYRLIFRAPDRTMTDGEADGAIEKILAKLAKIDITLRS